MNRYDRTLFSRGDADMAVTSEYELAERVVGEVAVLSDMDAGRLDEDGVRQAGQVLLNHRRSELSIVSIF